MNQGEAMKARVLISLAFVLALGLFVNGQAFAQTPSSKAAVKLSNINLIETTSAASDWTTLLQTNIKTSQQKDLMIGVSLEVGLYTRTLVKSKSGVSDTSSTMGAVEIQVLVDGKAAEPGAVVFGRRTQTLSATLEGMIAGCLTVDPATGSIILDPLCVTPEEIELILDTMNANSFNFALTDVGVGNHTVQVQARIQFDSSVQAGSAEAKATVGKGSVTVEEVRLVKDANIIM
jgi:hypothetical protein